MTRNARAPVSALLALVLSVHARAQGLPSGVIAGTVTGAGDGMPLPGATVTVSAAVLQGARQTVSAENGDFLLANLPPGEYTVEIELQGFVKVTQAGVRLGTSQRLEIAAAMSLETFREEVVVTASTDLVSKAPQTATTFTASALEQLPTTRSFESAVLLSPDVVARPVNRTVSAAPDAFSIAGGESYENAVNVDGVSPQENTFRLAEPVYVEDAVAEVTTLTSGISAEHGYFNGGVVNVLTRSGGNAFSGSLRATLINDAWSAGTPAGEERVDDVTPIWEATLGGPLWRDRAWFFGAGRLLDQTTVSSTAPPTSIDFPTDHRETRASVKLTVSPLASQTFTLGATRLDRNTDDTFYAPNPILDLAATYDDRVEEQMLLANYTGTLSDSLFVEAHYGRRRLTHVAGSTDTDLVTGTPLLYPTPWEVYHAPTLCAVCPDPEDRRNSDQGVLKATWFLPSGSLGSHTLVFGGETYSGSAWMNNYQSGSGNAVFGTDIVVDGGEVYPVLGPGTTLWVMPVPVPAAPNHIQTYSAYANDTWRLSERVTLTLGVRWDKNHARDPEGGTISDAAAFSPRLGVAWDATGEGRLRLTASYGRYVSLLSENQIYWSSPYGIQAMFVYLYDGPPVNTEPGQPLVGGSDALRQLYDWFGITVPGQFPRAGIDPIMAYLAGVNVKIQGGLEAQRADEVTVGVNGAIGSAGSYRVEVAERRYGNFYDMKLDTTTGTASDAAGNVYDLGLLTNTNTPYERRHRALKASVQLRLAPELTAGGSWAWSRTSGNQNSESLASGPMPPTTLTYPEYWELSWHAPVGDLPQDVRHRLRLWATWDVPGLPDWFGRLGVSPLFALDTGQPYGAAGEVLVGDYVTNPGYVTPPYSETYFFTGRDAYRTPTVTHLDLALAWRRHFGGIEVFVQPHVVNLFNNHAIASNDPSLIDQGVSTAVYDPGLPPFDPFTEQPVEGVHYVKSATFGDALAPEAYQQPRTFRISIGVRF